MTNTIIPGLLETDENILAQKIHAALEFAHTIHIDLIDETFGSATVNKPEFFREFTSLATFELHMMVENPHTLVKEYAKAGFKRFIGHIEHESNIESFITQVQEANAEAFLGFDLSTQIDNYQNSIQSGKIDGVMILCVDAGKSGQKFSHHALAKIKQVRRLNPTIDIEVDGGINNLTLPLTKESGANSFASTSFIFSASNPHQQFNTLKNLL